MNQINIANGTVFPFTIGIIILMLIFFLTYYIYMSFCVYKIAIKTDTKNAWFAWIPILDAYLSIQIARKPTWWIILFFIPLANIIVYVLIWMGIAKVLKKQEWLGILMIISPLNLIIPGYLAFSKNSEKNQGPTILASL